MDHITPKAGSDLLRKIAIIAVCRQCQLKQIIKHMLKAVTQLLASELTLHWVDQLVMQLSNVIWRRQSTCVLASKQAIGAAATRNSIET
jgi:hypothetical protein